MVLSSLKGLVLKFLANKPGPLLRTTGALLQDKSTSVYFSTDIFSNADVSHWKVSKFSSLRFPSLFWTKGKTSPHEPPNTE